MSTSELDPPGLADVVRERMQVVGAPADEPDPDEEQDAVEAPDPPPAVPDRGTTPWVTARGTLFHRSGRHRRPRGSGVHPLVRGPGRD